MFKDISIAYDGTVRDSGKNIIQFRYGEDGVDVCQAAFLQTNGINFFADNADLFRKRWHCDQLNSDSSMFRRLFKTNSLPRPVRLIADQVGVKRQTVSEDRKSVV